MGTNRLCRLASAVALAGSLVGLGAVPASAAPSHGRHGGGHGR